MAARKKPADPFSAARARRHFEVTGAVSPTLKRKVGARKAATMVRGKMLRSPPIAKRTVFDVCTGHLKNLKGRLWLTKVGRSVVDWHNTKGAAVSAAIVRAHMLWSDAGVPAQVRVRTQRGTWKEERTFGNDPKRRKG